MFQPLNTSPLNSGDMSYVAGESIHQRMVASGETDPFIIGWESASISMGCFGEALPNIIVFAESSHKMLRCRGETAHVSFASGESVNVMSCAGLSHVHEAVDGLSSHKLMQSHGEFLIDISCDSECLHQSMVCSGDVNGDYSQSILKFSR